MARRSGPEGRQDDRHDRIVALEDSHQSGIETAGFVIVGGGGEFVVEAEGVEESAQPGVVVGAEAVMRAERVGDLRQRLAEEGDQHRLVRDVVRHLAQAVHVVAERQQLRRQTGHFRKGVADPGGAGDLSERADMGQAGGTVAGLE